MTVPRYTSEIRSWPGRWVATLFLCWPLHLTHSHMTVKALSSWVGCLSLLLPSISFTLWCALCPFVLQRTGHTFSWVDVFIPVKAMPAGWWKVSDLLIYPSSTLILMDMPMFHLSLWGCPLCLLHIQCTSSLFIYFPASALNSSLYHCGMDIFFPLIANFKCPL